MADECRAKCVIRLILLGFVMVFVVGCSCKLTEPSYRFELSFDSAPSTYRNTGAAQERLVVPMWIRNLGMGDLCISQPATNESIANGLTVAARLISHNPYISVQQAEVSYGLRAGGTLRNVNEANRLPIFDRHNNAVADFAATAPNLIGLDEEKVLTAFRLLGNETMVLLSFPVDWTLVPSNPKAIESSLEIEVSLGYSRPDDAVLQFSETFSHRLRIYMINAVRGFRDRRPSADGPKTGTFEPGLP